MSESPDPRVVAALGPQFDRWRAELAGGAQRVGWKIGLNIPEVQEHFGLREPVIGHLTSATQLASGATYHPGADEQLRGEAEIALLIGRDVEPDADADSARDAIAGLATAIELVDVARPPGELEGILLGNVFHRAFAIGSPAPPRPAEIPEARLIVNDELTVHADVPDDFAGIVLVVARLLGALGERLREGDWIISGSVVHVPVAPGSRVAVEVDRLEAVEVTIAPEPLPRA